MLFRNLDRSRPRLQLRRAIMLIAVGALASAWFLAWGGPASATATATVSVSPSTGLVSGNSVTVTVTTPSDTGSTVFVAVTQCGNATSSGSPLASLATDGSDCVGSAGLGSTLQLIGAGGAASPVGPVTAGTYHVTLKLQESGIGTANTKCIAMPPATIPCSIVASTATITGAYTGDGSFQGQATISYADNVTTTSTTTAGTTTTTTTHSGTTTGSGSTTTVAGGATTPTTASGSSSQTASTSTSGLANTGPPALTWFLIIAGLLLVDVGYLALSATWKARRAKQGTGP